MNPRSLGLSVSFVCAVTIGGCGPSETNHPSPDLSFGNRDGGPGDFALLPSTDQAIPPGSDLAGVDFATPAAPAGWLHTQGNQILLSDGSVWHGRGANLMDTRSCNACAYGPPDPGEVNRRVDELVDNWHANFIRLDLESYGSAGGRVQWQGVLNDAGYLSDIQTIIAHIKTKPGVYVLLTLWVDPTFTSLGWPTAQTNQIWQKLADVFKNDAHVLFGLCNEPQSNFDGSMDPAVWTAMNDAVAAIRQVESTNGTPQHIITAQGTGGWARRTDYYVTHPITAGGGTNIAYEVHVYDPTSSFQQLFVTSHQTLPMIIGEFGESSGMTLTDCGNLVDQARMLEIPHLAWTFHMRCPPNLLVDNSGGGCGSGMSLQPTTGWGQFLKGRLAIPW